MFCYEVTDLSESSNSVSIDEELRQRLYQSVYEEFIGPIDPNSEETLDEFFSPSLRYHAGVLHPRGTQIDSADTKSDTTSEDEEPGATAQVGEKGGALSDEADIPSGASIPKEATDEDYEEPVSLSNARAQSAMSMTLGIRKGDRIAVSIRCAKYSQQKINDKSCYKRIPIQFELPPECIELPTGEGDDLKRGYTIEGEALELWIVFRHRISEGRVMTIALCNTNSASPGQHDEYAACYYQVLLLSSRFQSQFRLGPHPPGMEPGRRIFLRRRGQ